MLHLRLIMSVMRHWNILITNGNDKTSHLVASLRFALSGGYPLYLMSYREILKTYTILRFKFVSQFKKDWSACLNAKHLA